MNSLQLPMLSGIGPGAKLQALGIPVVADVPGVGRNLQDHWFSAMTFRAKSPASYNQELRSLRKYWHAARYLLTRRGYLALGPSPLSACVKSSPDLLQPDLQLVSRAMTFTVDAKGRIDVDSFPGISADGMDASHPLRPAGSAEQQEYR